MLNFLYMLCKDFYMFPVEYRLQEDSICVFLILCIFNWAKNYILWVVHLVCKDHSSAHFVGLILKGHI